MTDNKRQAAQLLALADDLVNFEDEQQQLTYEMRNMLQGIRADMRALASELDPIVVEVEVTTRRAWEDDYEQLFTRMRRNSLLSNWWDIIVEEFEGTRDLSDDVSHVGLHCVEMTPSAADSKLVVDFRMTLSFVLVPGQGNEKREVSALVDELFNQKGAVNSVLYVDGCPF